MLTGHWFLTHNEIYNQFLSPLLCIYSLISVKWEEYIQIQE